MGNKVKNPWTSVFHEDQDIIQLILDSPEGEENIWVTYEELAALKEFLQVVTPKKKKCKKCDCKD
jgi:hypothetical protein